MTLKTIIGKIMAMQKGIIASEAKIQAITLTICMDLIQTVVDTKSTGTDHNLVNVISILTTSIAQLLNLHYISHPA